MEKKASLQNLLFSYVRMVVLVFSRVSLFVILWTVAHQAPLSMGFSRQEYWRGLPCPSLGDLPDQGLSLVSPALQVGSSPLIHQGSLTCEAIPA